MATKQNANSIFMGTLELEQLNALRAEYDRMVADGQIVPGKEFPTHKLELAAGCKYSRAWQITRRWQLEEQEPQLLVDAEAITKLWRQDHPDWMPTLKGENPQREALHGIVKELRNGGCSWGEINVRLGLSEGEVRTMFNYKSGVKDKGLRIGKGGRFAYDDQLLYKANMKAEGAHIPADYKGKPQPQDCLNYRPEGQPVRKAARKPRKATTKAAAKAS